MSEILLLKFLKDNWKPIVLIILVALAALWVKSYINSVYQDGKQAGINETNEAWKVKYEKDVGALNNKITSIEDESRKTVNELQGRLDTANGQIDSLVFQLAKEKEKYDNRSFDSKGNVTCTSTTPNYLGKDFSKTWNAMNAEVLQ